MTNVAIFVSGGGTNCEAIIRHFAGSHDVKISLVLSNRADAYALVRAQNLGIPHCSPSSAAWECTDIMFTKRSRRRGRPKRV